VLQKVYEKVKFIENRSEKSCLVFKLEKDYIELISISSNADEVNMETPEGIHQALVHHADSLMFFRSKKVYSKTRELEIHEMILQGCVNSTESFWTNLEKVITA
jgi:hypothetical protein